jgi:hypothetical protein
MLLLAFLLWRFYNRKTILVGHELDDIQELRGCHLLACSDE